MIVRLFVVTALFVLSACGFEDFSTDEKAAISNLSLAALPPLAPDPSNLFSDDVQAAALGKMLFHDPRLSATGTVSCASCHIPERQFQDDLALAVAIGTNTRRTMPLAGASWGPWFFWDGRKDSQWSQALGPLENPLEHGGDRTFYATFVAGAYRQAYENIFGALPHVVSLPTHASPLGSAEQRKTWTEMAETDRDVVDRVFVNIGKALAAYQRTLPPIKTRFDRFAQTLSGKEQPAQQVFTTEEIAGLKLFIGKAGCVSCHTGPRFTDDHFHNTGVPALNSHIQDRGRAAILEQITSDPFNCLGKYSDAKAENCGELRFMSRNIRELENAFKTPSLRGVATRGPFMHAGQFKTLVEVVDHYSNAPESAAGHSELKKLGLRDDEKHALIAFLKTLN
jgi:cytochrome c peroxidase